MKPDALLADFAQALGQLEDALKIRADHNVIRAGCIQYFEFTFELAWKTIKSIAENEGLDPGGSPKSCLRVAFIQKWIDEEAIWLEMLNARNRMSHTYDAKDALAIYEQLPAFIKPLVELLTRLQQSLHRGGGEC
jgi:nucleotidyltransferase substrate binding protein (TIGR01987 family)